MSREITIEELREGLVYPKMLVWDSAASDAVERTVVVIQGNGDCMSEDDLWWRHCKPLPQKRLMTQEECIGWAYNESALGWQISFREIAFGHPTVPAYDGEIEEYTRRRVFPNGTFGEAEPMWFEGDE